MRAEMLAKVITLTHRRGGKGFGPVLRYLLRVDRRKDSPPQPVPESGHLQLAEEPLWSVAEDSQAYAEDVARLFDSQTRECRGRGRFRGNPVYHVAINWKEGEHPTCRQAERASQHVTRALGFGECQAVWALHRDSDSDHVHLVINRVHPIKLTAVSVPRRDYFVLDRCMRELELELGFARAHGPYVTIATAEGPKYVDHDDDTAGQDPTDRPVTRYAFQPVDSKWHVYHERPPGWPTALAHTLNFGLSSRVTDFQKRSEPSWRIKNLS